MDITCIRHHAARIPARDQALKGAAARRSRPREHQGRL
jgi:hypothetical protein